jgi:AraC-like DNA-binding protein
VKFINRIPSFPLNNFVEYILHYEDYNPAHPKEKILPDGGIDLIIDLTEESKTIFNNEDYSRFRTIKKGWISGVRKEFITIGASHQAMIVIRFKPGRAFPFFKFPLSELTDKIIELDEIWNSRFLHLRDKLINFTNPNKRVETVESFLLKISKNKLDICKSVDFTIDELSRKESSVKIKELADKIGYSHKHFVHLFEQKVGITPKYYSRIMKFQQAVMSLERQKNVDWFDLAYQCAYYDQSHFVNEFKRFSGLNPTSYLKEKGEIINYIPVF